MRRGQFNKFDEGMSSKIRFSLRIGHGQRFRPLSLEFGFHQPQSFEVIPESLHRLQRAGMTLAGSATAFTVEKLDSA
jgi:hypothetical protein